MQQYRFNFPLFIGLVIGTLVCSGAVYGLWRFQIARKSDWLLSEAEKAQQADDFKEAARSYQQYLSIQPKDDNVRLKLAMAYADITKSNDITFADLAAAIDSIENTLRISTIAGKPEAKQLRRRLVELFGRPGVNRYPDALEHLGVLLESDPSDPELQAMRAANLARAGNFDEAVRLSYKLIGYDPEADEFDPKKAVAPKNVELYASLAATLRTRQDKPELADRVMDQLVEANPQSAEAHLALGRYQTSLGNADEGRAEIEEAYELAPNTKRQSPESTKASRKLARMTRSN
jgi:tetratricopeptide (TPR) repeat protein